MGGVAVGSLLGPILADILMSILETKVLHQCMKKTLNAYVSKI